ncbi:hypothetical protein [Spongiactinospora sp. 9N601]
MPIAEIGAANVRITTGGGDERVVRILTDPRHEFAERCEPVEGKPAELT